MKLDDIIKHYREEKKDLSLANVFWFIILFSFIYIAQNNAQILINGFCKIDKFHSASQLNKIFTCDFNQDSLRDVILFNPGERKYSVHRAINYNKFTESLDRNFDFPIDDINIYSTNSSKLVFASRNERTVGLASVSFYGQLQISFKKVLNSYPSQVYAADMNNDGFKKIIAAGNSFAGIEFINPNNTKEKSINLFTEKSFESLVIFDFNYDYYNDIVAIDFLDNQLVFINNYSNNYFVIERTIPYLEKITELRLAKFNSDEFYDLMFLSESSVDILLGDSVYSFARKISIPTGNKAANYTYGDFNNDGFNDVGFLKNDEKTIYLSLSNGTSSLSTPIAIFSDKELEDIASITSKKLKIISLTNGGSLVSISSIETNEKEFSIGLAHNVSTFGSFATADYSYFFIEDDDNQIIKIFQHTGAQPFKFLYYFTLLKKHEIINTEVISKDIVRFFCYSNNSSLIEIIDFNFKTKKTVRSKVVAEGPMTDYIFEKRKKDLIRVLAIDKENLISSVYEFSKNKVKYLHEDTLYNALGGVYSRNDTRRAYIWRKTSNGISYEIANFSDGSKSVIKFINWKEFSFDVTKLKMTLDFDSHYLEKTISYFGGGESAKLFMGSSNSLKEIKVKNISRLALYKSPNHINLTNELYSDRKKIFMYNKIIDAENIDDFIISNKIDRYLITAVNNKKYFTFSRINDNQLTFIGIK